MSMSEGRQIRCDNPTCSRRAARQVPVSVNSLRDNYRNYCFACYEAYEVGVQHGRFVGKYEWLERSESAAT